MDAYSATNITSCQHSTVKLMITSFKVTVDLQGYLSENLSQLRRFSRNCRKANKT